MPLMHSCHGTIGTHVRSRTSPTASIHLCLYPYGLDFLLCIHEEHTPNCVHAKHEKGNSGHPQQFKLPAKAAWVDIQMEQVGMYCWPTCDNCCKHYEIQASEACKGFGADRWDTKNGTVSDKSHQRRQQQHLNRVPCHGVHWVLQHSNLFIRAAYNAYLMLLGQAGMVRYVQSGSHSYKAYANLPILITVQD